MTMREKIETMTRIFDDVKVAALGLKTCIAPYVLNENKDIDIEKVEQLVDTITLYCVRENKEITPEDIKFLKVLLKTSLILSSIREAYAEEEMTFNLVRSYCYLGDALDISFINWAEELFIRLSPIIETAQSEAVTEEEAAIIMRKLDAGVSPDDIDVLRKAKEKALEYEDEWVEKHPNAKLRNQLKEDIESMPGLCQDITLDIAETIEVAFASFLKDRELVKYTQEDIDEYTAQLAELLL